MEEDTQRPPISPHFLLPPPHEAMSTTVVQTQSHPGAAVSASAVGARPLSARAPNRCQEKRSQRRPTLFGSGDEAESPAPRPTPRSMAARRPHSLLRMQTGVGCDGVIPRRAGPGPAEARRRVAPGSPPSAPLLGGHVTFPPSRGGTSGPSGAACALLGGWSCSHATVGSGRQTGPGGQRARTTTTDDSARLLRLIFPFPPSPLRSPRARGARSCATAAASLAAAAAACTSACAPSARPATSRRRCVPR
jgi:hypothetical protein